MSFRPPKQFCLAIVSKHFNGIGLVSKLKPMGGGMNRLTDQLGGGGMNRLADQQI